MKTTAEQTRINAATTLDDLAETLNTIAEELRAKEEEDTFAPSIDDLVDVAELPTFGGADPKHTSEVWSWDERRIITASGSTWVIENRCDCGEAEWHCRCEK